MDQLKAFLVDTQNLWPAIEAIATALTLIYVFFQLNAIRRERSHRNVQGIRFINDELNDPEYIAASTYVFEKDDDAGDYYNNLDIALKKLDFISQLIDNRLIDKDVFTVYYRTKMLNIFWKVDQIEKYDYFTYPNLLGKHINARRLLRRVYKEYIKNNTRNHWNVKIESSQVMVKEHYTKITKTIKDNWNNSVQDGLSMKIRNPLVYSISREDCFPKGGCFAIVKVWLAMICGDCGKAAGHARC